MFGIYCLLFLPICLYFYFTRTFKYWKLRNVNGPKPIPIFGNFLEVALRKKSMQQFYGEVYKRYPDEKVVGIYRMTSPALLIRDLDIAKQVLIKDFKSCSDRGTYFSKTKLGDNLFHSDSKTWSTLKPHFSSLFTPSKCKSRFHLLIKKGNDFANYAEELAKKTPEQDMYRLFQYYTGSTTMSSLFDIDVDRFDNTNLFENVDKVLVKLSHFNELDMLLPGIMKQLNLGLFSNKIVKFCQQIIDKGKSMPEFSKSDKQSVMSVMMDLRREERLFDSKMDYNDEDKESLKVTDDFLAGQAFIFYIAGYGNSNLLLSYTMYYLAKYPEVQDKLISEIDSINQKYNYDLTYSALLEMKYLYAVFQEALRMHPLANSIIRSATENIKIDGTDLIINKGVSMIISAYGIQHDEKYYPEPEVFRPERFLDNVEQDPMAFLSFGAGPRKCLGIKFAFQQYGVCVVKLLSKFHILATKNTVKHIEFNPWTVLSSPKENIQLKLAPR